jgi:hypothetical protein
MAMILPFRLTGNLSGGNACSPADEAARGSAQAALTRVSAGPDAVLPVAGSIRWAPGSQPPACAIEITAVAADAAGRSRRAVTSKRAISNSSLGRSRRSRTDDITGPLQLDLYRWMPDLLGSMRPAAIMFATVGDTPFQRGDRDRDRYRGGVSQGAALVRLLLSRPAPRRDPNFLGIKAPDRGRPAPQMP